MWKWVALSVCSLVAIDERTEVERLAERFAAQTEVRLWDNTRADMVTATEAYEVDYAPKWAEAVGQSLYYAEVLRKKPAIVLLVRNLKSERQFVYRCQTVCAAVGIRLYVVKL
ncbi:hypothetical protein [uncultured Mediterranean phage uvDeep-CGR2-KM19-C37]|nr:hypothetical protein [uncultured Mediterranean phage uvDeep-CGR2-KM19-C37]